MDRVRSNLFGFKCLLSFGSLNGRLTSTETALQESSRRFSTAPADSDFSGFGIRKKFNVCYSSERFRFFNGSVNYTLSTSDSFSSLIFKNS